MSYCRVTSEDRVRIKDGLDAGLTKTMISRKLGFHKSTVGREITRNKGLKGYRLSMKLAGKALGVSDSYISQIENGRADCPEGERLKPYLDLYGKIGAKYFYELCRNWEKESTDEDFIKDNVGKLSKDNSKL